ncbi:MAG: hypothetical protein WBA93_00090 [Microcoleaceae cyanobacterium]
MIVILSEKNATINIRQQESREKIEKFSFLISRQANSNFRGIIDWHLRIKDLGWFEFLDKINDCYIIRQKYNDKN